MQHFMCLSREQVEGQISLRSVKVLFNDISSFCHPNDQAEGPNLLIPLR
jgi:hypothetical protein